VLILSGYLSDFPSLAFSFDTRFDTPII
jgi:hypothetical protein